MKASDVFKNIQLAKSEIDKLKQQMKYLSSPDMNQNLSMNTYMNVMQYNINKFQNTVERSIAQINKFQTKLPSIKQDKIKNYNNQQPTSRNLNQQRIFQPEFPPSKAYKKLRGYIKSNKQNDKSKDEITRPDSLSLSIVNRPIKMHSFIQKNFKYQFQTDMRPVGAKLDLSNFVKQSIQSQHIKHAPKHETYQHNQNMIKQYNLMKHSSHKSRSISEKQQSVSLINQSTPLEYKQVVDRYSMYHFMIRKGKIISETPQFASYKRIYESIFRKVKLIIQRIQELLIQYQVELSYVDGKKMAILALKKQITIQDLIDCLVDNDKIKATIMPTTKFSGVEGKIKAAIIIQSYWRMYAIRKQYRYFKQKIIKIQIFVKKILSKLRTRRTIHQKNEQIYQSFIKHQKNLIENYKSLIQKPHYQIHINSFSVDEMKRLTIANFNQKKNLQLTRIFRLSDEKVNIIYITPVDLPIEIINYYYKILELANIKNYKDRLIFIKPEAVQSFPQHMSTSKLLYYSPKCLKKLKKIINNKPCFMIPGFPCNQTIKICQILNINLLSGDPLKCKYFSTKSHSRRLFEASDLPVAPGAIQLYDITEFINTLSVLISNNPQIQTWIFKIDDQFGGRGLAYLNVSKIKSIQRLINQKLRQTQESQEEKQFFQTALQNQQPQFDQEFTTQIRNILKSVLPQRVKICYPQLYRNYEEFMNKYLKKGGTIQAYPNLRKQNIKSPSVSFFIAPGGQIQIISTYEKISSQPFVNVACNFPQQSIEYSIIYKCCKNLSQALYLRGAFGYFTLDFIAFKEQNEEKYRYWAIGLDSFLNTYTSSFYYFNILMGGRYLSEQNEYLIQENQQPMKIQKQKEKSIETNVSLERLSRRKYMFIPYIYHDNLNTVKMKTFFKNARFQNINYDIQNKQGICILLIDQLSSGVLGLLAIHKEKEFLIETLHKTLTFIEKQTPAVNVKYGLNQNEARDDNILLRDIMSLITIMKKRNEKVNFKKVAYKKNLINCNLELIL